MNVNLGLFPPIAEPRVDKDGKRLRGPSAGLPESALSARAEEDLADWVAAVVAAEPLAHPKRRA